MIGIDFTIKGLRFLFSLGAVSSQRCVSNSAIVTSHCAQKVLQNPERPEESCMF